MVKARARFAACNPASRSACERAATVLPDGNTRSVLHCDRFPLIMVRSEGCHLQDSDAHVYPEVPGEFTTDLEGHSHPVILKAARTALGFGFGLSLGSQAPHETALAESIVARIPFIERLHSTKAGTEANLMALAPAHAVAGRVQIMVLRGVQTFPADSHAVTLGSDRVKDGRLARRPASAAKNASLRQRRILHPEPAGISEMAD